MTLSSPSPSKPGADQGGSTTSAAVRVLVLDDQKEIADFLAQLVELMGYEVKAESNPARALELVEDEEFDVILTDYRMPEMNGADFYHATVARRPELADRVIFLSGDVSGDFVFETIDLLGAASLKKPFNFSSVQQAIERVLKIAAAQE